LPTLYTGFAITLSSLGIKYFFPKLAATSIPDVQAWVRVIKIQIKSFLNINLRHLKKIKNIRLVV